MRTVVWAAPARRDFLDVVAYLTDRSPRAAVEFLETVELRVERLERFPDSGRKVPETLGSEPVLREPLIGDYRLVYVHRRKLVEIVALFHGRRRFTRGLLH